MSDECSECDSVRGDGNTRSPPIAASLRWCFTLNNYTNEDLNHIVSCVRQYCRYGIMGKEVGESGTPHLQGYIEFLVRRRPKGVFGLTAIHWEKAKGSKEDNYLYCTKEDSNAYVYPEPYCPDIVLYPWQVELKHMLDAEPDDRSIMWVFEPDGCAGKTTFCKWLCAKYPKSLCLSGKCSDMKNGIVQYAEKSGHLPSLVIIDIPRSRQEWVSYTGVEEVKDMFFYSGKYEGGMVNGPSPHVLVMSNSLPDLSKMSSDRWKLWRVVSSKLGLSESDLIDDQASNRVVLEPA